MSYDDEPARENIAQTVAKIMEKLPMPTPLEAHLIPRDLASPLLVALPLTHNVQDFTKALRDAQSVLKPFVRKGTAKLANLASLISWGLRFKAANSVLFALNQGEAPTLTCIADYHLEGPPMIDNMGDTTARHGQHRASYAFPVSKKWQAWMKASGTAMSGIEMGQFLEDNILDVIDPPTSLTLPGIAGAEATEAEHRLIDIARRLEGSYGNASQLMGMAKSFTVNEAADYTVAHNSTTGEATVQIKSEHMDANGQPIRVPKLFLIAIPVFEDGPAYRLPVRFQYRKAGQTVKFFLTLHDPKFARDHAFDEAVQLAKAETGMPLFIGQPEAPN